MELLEEYKKALSEDGTFGLNYEDGYETVRESAELYEGTSGTDTFNSPIIHEATKRLIESALNQIGELDDNDVQVMLLHIILILQFTIQRNFRAEEFSHLPPINLIQLDDESYLLEWIFPDFRLGFSIENPIQESSWYLTSNRRLNEIEEFGYLRDTNLELLMYNSLSYIVANT